MLAKSKSVNFWLSQTIKACLVSKRIVAHRYSNVLGRLWEGDERARLLPDPSRVGSYHGKAENGSMTNIDLFRHRALAAAEIRSSSQLIGFDRFVDIFLNFKKAHHLSEAQRRLKPTTCLLLCLWRPLSGFEGLSFVNTEPFRSSLLILALPLSRLLLAFK